MRDAMDRSAPVATQPLERPGWPTLPQVRPVPKLSGRPDFLTHSRLRRTSPIAQYAVASALEALGPDAQAVARGELKLGVIFCTMTGSINYSRRFYMEAWADPATASPLLFPETVFNAPASHIAALLGSTDINYTLVGDSGTFLVALSTAADWLLSGRVEGCIVIGAEELDWLTVDACRLFARGLTPSAGAGALYLRAADGPGVVAEIDSITDAHLFTKAQNRTKAAQAVRAQLGAIDPQSTLLCDGNQGCASWDAAELRAWQGWTGPRLSPKHILGEGLATSGAWQCVAAIDAMRQKPYDSVAVNVVGCNQQAIAARFKKIQTHS